MSEKLFGGFLEELYFTYQCNAFVVFICALALFVSDFPLL